MSDKNNHADRVAFEDALQADLDLATLFAARVEEEKPCGYLPEQKRQDMRFAFDERASPIQYMIAAEAAFESGLSYDAGRDFYVSECPSCNACKPLRYPVADFRRSASQQAAWKMMPMRNVSVHQGGYGTPAMFAEHVALADRYYATRFPRDHAVLPTQQRLAAPFYLNKNLVYTVIELRTWDYQLVAGSLNVETPNSYFGVQYYYDPALLHLQPGKQTIMTLLQTAREQHKDYLYVGPWNPLNKHIQGKTYFRPYELYIDGKWQRFNTPNPGTACVPA